MDAMTVKRARARVESNAVGAIAQFAMATGLARFEGCSALVDQSIKLEACWRSFGRGTTTRRPEARVHWHEDGDGTGAIVLLNGWTLSGRVWPVDLIEPLAEHHRVVRVDNRGTGDSRGMPWPFTIADMARDLHDVVVATGIEGPTIVGFSLGGMIAQEFAVRWPALVGSLVLVSSRPPSPAGFGGEPSVLRRALMPPPLDRPMVEVSRERWEMVSGPGFAARHPERLDEMADSVFSRVTPRAVVMSQARAAIGWHGPTRLCSLDVPCTVVHGAADPLTPAENSRRIVKLIRGSELVELPGVGHLVPQEAPGALGEIIMERSGRSR